MTRAVLEISSIDPMERAELIANFEIATTKAYQCTACLATSLPALRKRKGCEDDGAHYQLGLGGKSEFLVKTCLGNLWSPDAFHWLGAYEQFKNGVMPFEGTFMEQPAKAIDIFNLFAQLEAELVEKKSKEAKQSNKGPGRGKSR